MRGWKRLSAVVGLCLVALACSERNPRFQPAVTSDGPVEPGPIRQHPRQPGANISIQRRGVLQGRHQGVLDSVLRPRRIAQEPRGQPPQPQGVRPQVGFGQIQDPSFHHLPPISRHRRSLRSPKNDHWGKKPTQRRFRRPAIRFLIWEPPPGDPLPAGGHRASQRAQRDASWISTASKGRARMGASPACRATRCQPPEAISYTSTVCAPGSISHACGIPASA